MPEKLLVELDGGQHAERAAQDERRDAFLRSKAFRVLRFWNNEVFENCFGVLERVYEALPNPPPRQTEPAGSTAATPPQGGSDGTPSLLTGSTPSPLDSAPSPLTDAPSPSKGEGWGGGAPIAPSKGQGEGGGAPAPAAEWTVERARAYLAGMDPQIVDLFPDRLVDSELGEIPEGWEVKGLDELIELAYGKALKADDRKGGSVPVYGSNGQIGWHDASLVAGPGIVVGRKGNPGIVTWTHGEFFPIDTTFYVVPKDTNSGLPFLFFALTSQDLPSVAADSAVPGLNRNLAYMNRQLLPDNRVAAEFNIYASDIFLCRHHLDEESRILTTQRDALLPGLISGKVKLAGMCQAGLPK